MSSVTTLYPDLPFEGRFMENDAKAEALGFDPDIFRASGGFVVLGSRGARDQPARNNLRAKAAEADAVAKAKMATAQPMLQAGTLQARAQPQKSVPVRLDPNGQLQPTSAAVDDSQSDLMRYLMAALMFGNRG